MRLKVWDITKWDLRFGLLPNRLWALSWTAPINDDDEGWRYHSTYLRFSMLWIEQFPLQLYWHFHPDHPEKLTLSFLSRWNIDISIRSIIGTLFTPSGKPFTYAVKLLQPSRQGLIKRKARNLLLLKDRDTSTTACISLETRNLWTLLVGKPIRTLCWSDLLWGCEGLKSKSSGFVETPVPLKMFLLYYSFNVNTDGRFAFFLFFFPSHQTFTDWNSHTFNTSFIS